MSLFFLVVDFMLRKGWWNGNVNSVWYVDEWLVLTLYSLCVYVCVRPDDEVWLKKRAYDTLKLRDDGISYVNTDLVPSVSHSPSHTRSAILDARTL